MRNDQQHVNHHIDHETGTALEVDIAIVGGGMVGAALAAALGDTKYKLAIIDAQDENSLCREVSTSDDVASFEPLVSALTSASQNLLKETGAWDLVPTQLQQAYRKMRVWDELGTAEIVFDAAEIYQEALGCIVENQSVLASLQKVLKQQYTVRRLYGEKIRSVQRLSGTELMHSLTLESGQEIHCRLLVAADGALSRIRQWAGIATREWDYQHSAIVCTVETENPHELTAWQRFSEFGPLAFLPLPDAEGGQHFCSIVWSQETERARQLMALDDLSFMQALENAFEARLGKVMAVSARQAFPLRQRHAKNYVKPGLALIGDAAHTIHPLAGQGVNLGFMDAAVLANELLHGSEIGRELNDLMVLKRYQRKRIGQNLGMMWMMEGFKHLFAEQALPVRWLRNIGMTGADNLSIVKNHLARRAMGLDW